MGLKKYGKGDWRNISRNFVITRTPTQVASHAQKYFIRQVTGVKDKRRSSIHDITTVNLPNTPSSSDSFAAIHAYQQANVVAATNEVDFEWKQHHDRGAAMVVDPSLGISSYGPKPEEQNLLRETHQNLLRETHPGSLFGSYDGLFHMQSMQHQ